MWEADLQNQVASDTLMASQGETGVAIPATCCVHIPDESGNVSTLLDDVKSQIQNVDGADTHGPEVLFDVPHWFSSLFSIPKGCALCFQGYFNYCLCSSILFQVLYVF